MEAVPGRGAGSVVIEGRVGALGAGAPGLENAFAAYTAQFGPGYEYEATQVTVDRIRDEDAKDNGQFGLAYRYFAEALNGTEFALYYTRTHARTPVVGSRINKINTAGLAGVPETSDTSEYQMAYVEDQDMFGASFNTVVGTMSLAGELAYRPKRSIINEIGDNLIQSLAGAAANPAPTLGDLTLHCVRAELAGSRLSANTSVQAGQLSYFYDDVGSYNGTMLNRFNCGVALGTYGLVALVDLVFELFVVCENKV